MENTIEKKVLAVVGEKEITNHDVEDALRSLDQYQAMQFNSAEGKNRLLNDLVNQELFYMEAKDQNLHNDENFRKEMQRVEDNMLKQYSINRLLTNITLTDEEIQAYYEANKQQFMNPETAKASHILVESEEEASDLLNKINTGEMKFEEAALQCSQCPSKEVGGDLGSFGRGQMVPEFEEAVFNMNPGEVKGPVKTEFGYHLIKVEDRNQGGQASLDEVRAEIAKGLTYQKQNEIYTNKVNELQAKYPVKFNG
jgi:peptidyl-prolyl cis-trans isomerase C